MAATSFASSPLSPSNVIEEEKNNFIELERGAELLRK